MIVSRLIPIIICVLISGCAQHVKISPRKCIAPDARWALGTDIEEFSYTTHIRIDNRSTYLKNIFRDEEQSCGGLKTIKLTHKYTWQDVLWNLIPFVGRSTLVVSGSRSTSNSQK